jgi:prolycopene isomerase
MRLTIEKLTGPRLFAPEYLSWIRGMTPTLACFLSHIGLRDTPRSVLEKVHGYYWRGWNSDGLARGDFDFKVFVPTLYEPKMAPAGRHIIIIQKVTDVDYESVSDWSSHKQRVEDFLLRRMEDLIPQFRDKIEVCLSATANTSHRFTLNYRGAMLGWEMSPRQLGEHRPDIESPIKNLYFVGQWTRPGGGITPVIVSAMRASNLIAGSMANVDCAVDDPNGKAALYRTAASNQISPYSPVRTNGAPMAIGDEM